MYAPQVRRVSSDLNRGQFGRTVNYSWVWPTKWCHFRANDIIILRFNVNVFASATSVHWRIRLFSVCSCHTNHEITIIGHFLCARVSPWEIGGLYKFKRVREVEREREIKFRNPSYNYVYPVYRSHQHTCYIIWTIYIITTQIVNCLWICCHVTKFVAGSNFS